jgi:hypothetical protein
MMTARGELSLEQVEGMLDLNRTGGRCVIIRTASGEFVAVAPGETPDAGKVVIPGNYPHPSLPWWSPEARELRRNETIQRLVDTIPWLDPDEDIGPYIDDHGFRLPEPGEDEE